MNGERSDYAKIVWFYWAFALSILIVVISRLYGYGLANTPVFAVYIAFACLICHKVVTRALRFNLIFVYAVAFFGFGLLSLVLQFDLYGSMLDRNYVDSYQNAINNLVIGFVYFVFGLVLVLPRERNLSFHALFLVSLLFLVLLSRGGGVVNYKELEASTGIEVDQIQISQSAVILVFLAFAYARGGLRLSVFLLGSVTLFLSGSRTAFAMGVAAMFYILMRLEKPQGAVKIGLIVFFLTIPLLGVVDLASDDATARMLFLGGVASDSSAGSRLLQFLGGVEGLKDQILIGDFNYVVRQFDGVGWYIHNGLSFWQQYGALVFLIFVMLLVSMFRQARRDLLDPAAMSEPALVFRTIFLLYCLLAVFFSLAYTYKFFWLLVGLYCRPEKLDEWEWRWYSF